MSDLQQMVTEGVMTAIGNTPLVELKRIPRPAGLRLFAKLEGCNPWGSIKDRTALSIVRDAISRGDIGPETVVVESSSGNLGLGLAHLCNYLNLRFICVVDSRTNSPTLDMLRLLGVETVMVDAPSSDGSSMLSCRLATVKSICDRLPNAFWPNQYANPSNPNAHFDTMREISEQLDHEADFLFCPVSTCGTLRGCILYIRSKGLKTAVVAVDAVGSSIAGGESGERLLPGHGAGIEPPHYDAQLVDDHVRVADEEAIKGCQQLLRFESIFAGASSGAAISAVGKTKLAIPPGATCVLILPDRGERYLDTVFSDSWVEEHIACREFSKRLGDPVSGGPLAAVSPHSAT